MMSNRFTASLAVLLMTAVALSGCGGGGGGGATSPTTSGTGGNNTASPTTGTGNPIAPGVAKQCTYTYQANAAPTGDCNFAVSTNWTTLNFKWWANNTAQCWVVGAEPGTSGTVSPKITFSAGSPASAKVTIDGQNLPTASSCGTAGAGTLTGFPKEQSNVANILGSWTATTQGLRGANLRIDFLITGR